MMSVIQPRSYQSRLYRSTVCAHRDESGTEAVEWLAVGAALFMFALALSVVLDINGSQLGQALTGQIESIVGDWGQGRDASATTLSQGNAAKGSGANAASAQNRANQASSSPGDRAVDQSTFSQRARNSTISTTVGASSGNRAVNTSASFNGSSVKPEARPEAASADQSGGNTSGGNTSDGSTTSAGASDRGNLIISDAQQRRDITSSGDGDDGDSKKNKGAVGPFGELWTQIERRVRPITDAINHAFASIFQKE